MMKRRDAETPRKAKEGLGGLGALGGSALKGI